MSMDEASLWIRELVRRGHGSPLEHCSYTFLVECSRICSHQLVRHRIASYTQQSMRYTEGFLRKAVLELCKLTGKRCPGRPRDGNDYSIYIEVVEEVSSRLNMLLDEVVNTLSAAFVFPPRVLRNQELLVKVSARYLDSVGTYYELLARGVAKEDARFVLPLAIRTRVIVTMNARELIESFLPLRMCSRAQWEIRLAAWLLWRKLVMLHPQLFSYAGPRCVYMENRVRGEPCKLQEFLEGRCDFTISNCPELVPREGIANCLRHSSTIIDDVMAKEGSLTH